MSRTEAARPAAPAPAAEITGPLSIRYVRLSDAVLWDRNPKLHDMGGLITSIRVHGFRDAPIFDAALGAIVAGNGRTTALQQMRAQGRQQEDVHWPPLAVIEDAEGEWLVPMQVGIDAPTREQAEAFGMDHNLLTATGGDLGFVELARMFDREKLVEVAQATLAHGIPVVTFDPDDLAAILEFANPPPIAPSEGGGRARENDGGVYTCPHCGSRFTLDASGNPVMEGTHGAQSSGSSADD